MWKCKRCETYNGDSEQRCNSCDWESPFPLNMDAILDSRLLSPVYKVTWNFQHATSVVVNDVDTSGPSGYSSITIDADTTLKLTAKNEYAEKTFSLFLYLPPPVITRLTVSDTIISLERPIIVEWEVKYAETLSLSEAGDVSGQAKAKIQPDKSMLVVLTAKNKTGEQQESVSLELPLPIIRSLFADQGKIIAGEELLLSWVTSNAQELSIDRVGKVDNPREGSYKLAVEASMNIVVTAANNTGVVSESLWVEVFPAPEIRLSVTSLNVLLGHRASINWKAIHCERVFLVIEDDVVDVTGKDTYMLTAERSLDIWLVGESVGRMKKDRQHIVLNVVQPVKIDLMQASPTFSIQFKHISISWEVSHAEEIVLLPANIQLEASGTIDLLPAERTVYSIVARNALTKDTKSVEVDVLPIPILVGIHLPSPPTIDVTDFARIWTEDLPKKSKKTALAPLYAGSISFRQRLRSLSIEREGSLLGIIDLLRVSTKFYKEQKRVE